MVNTFLSEEDQAVKQQFEQFAKDKLAPLSKTSDKAQAISISFLQELGQAGYLGFNAPVNYGGKDFSFLHLVLLAEIFAHYNAGIVVHLAYHAAFIELLKVYGSEEQKKLYLPKLAKGEILGTIAYLEENQNSQPIQILHEGNKTILEGSKKSVVATLNEAKDIRRKNYQPNLMAVLAQDNIILINDLSASNIKIEAQNVPLEPKSIYLYNIFFQKYCFKETDILTNTKEKTDQAISFARDIIKTILAAISLGMAESALSQTTNYVQAAQHNNKPLSESQAVLWKLADASSDINAARLLVYKAAWSKDEDQEAFSRHAAMAKAYAAKKANQHIGETMQILLPLLQAEHFDLSCFYIDSKILESFDATNEEEKVLLSKLLGI